MTIRAVFFDMGGTIERLWYTQECRLIAALRLQKLLHSYSIDPGLEEKEFFEVITKGYAHYHRWSMDTMEELPPSKVWSDFILEGIPVDDEKLSHASEKLMFTLENGFFQRELRPEVPSILCSLKEQGFKIGLISNVCSRQLVYANLEKYGIRDYFDPIVLSCEYGRRKPDPAIFHYAARLASIPTRVCAHVGDRIARDIIGARKAGYALAIQIINDFDFGEEEGESQPDAVITSMDQLLDVLASQGVSHVCDHEGETASGKGVCAFLFDAGDILYHRPRGHRRLNAFLSELGLSEKEISADDGKKLKDQAFNGSISQSQYRKAYLGLYGITDPHLVERGSLAIEEDENCVQFFKGVRETLSSLKAKGYLLGVITDTANPIHVKLGWFEREGIVDVWDTFISSKEIGVEKPDHRIYAAALNQLGLQPHQAIFVGHSPEELDGAHAHGMKTVAFNYKMSARADYYIEKFEDLLKVPDLDRENRLD